MPTRTTKNYTDDEIDAMRDGLGLLTMENMVRLYTIPRGSKIYGEELNMLHEKKPIKRIIRFGRIDGAYSYCTIEELDGTPVLYKDALQAVIHLSAMTPLVKYDDGYRIYRGKYSEDKED